MKSLFKWLIKAFAAGCIAFAALSLFAFFWYNVPVHYANPSGATEYIWESHKFYSKGTEGFALGQTNNEGFNNLEDYHDGDQIDILLMGSSHTEGFNVAQQENMGAVVNSLFDGEKYCYNIGTAGHTLPYCVKNLSDALDHYKPTQYLVLESYGVEYSPEEMQKVVAGELADIPSHTGGIVGILQKLPYLRLFYTQFFKDGNNAFDGAASLNAAKPENISYEDALDAFLDEVAREAKDHGITAIIVHNKNVELNEDGSGYFSGEPDKLALFARLCDEKGIVFIDMCPVYMRLYQQEHALAYGFSNTSPGSGHMNATGHRLFAEELVRTIREMEA